MDYLNYFPKKSCYPNQLEAMKNIHDALIQKQIVLFEGACGTGKTLSSLAPALYVGKTENKVIVIATNVHQHMTQFIEETREIKKQTNIKVIVLKSKIWMCPIPEMDYDTCSAMCENTIKLNELQKELEDLKNNIQSAREKFKIEKNSGLAQLQKELQQEFDNKEKQFKLSTKNSCGFFHNILKNEPVDFQPWLFGDVRTADEVKNWASKNSMCGYELLKQNLSEADLLICNYRHFLDKVIRNNILRWMKREIADVITIFDEAHNIEGVARSLSSMTLTEKTVDDALEEVIANEDINIIPEAITLLQVLLDNIKTSYDILLDKIPGEREKVGIEWHDLRISDTTGRTDMFMSRLKMALEKKEIREIKKTIEDLMNFGLAVNKKYEKRFKDGQGQTKKKSSSLTTAVFLSFYNDCSKDKNYYPILNVKRDKKEKNKMSGRLELFACIPRDVTAPLFNGVHSAILMSATLASFDTIKNSLGIIRQTREFTFGMTFPKEKRLTLAVSVPALFSKDRDSPQTKEIITKVLTEIIVQTDGNVLIFFPSFNEATKYKNRIKCDYPVFFDEVGVSANLIQDEFFMMGESGKKAVLISYMWGTLTEGVNYENNRGRTVVIVGVGYPALNDRTRAVESAYDAEFGQGWEYAIKIPTIRKVRQALGRVVRSPSDYGARVLLDGRYTSTSGKRYGKYSVFKFFPEEERSEFIDVEPDRVKYSLMNFFKDINKEKDINSEIKVETETSVINKTQKIQKDIFENEAHINKYSKIESNKLQIEEQLNKIEINIKEKTEIINSINNYYNNINRIDSDPSIEKRRIKQYRKLAKELKLKGDEKMSDLLDLININEADLNVLKLEKNKLFININELKDLYKKG